MSKNRVFFLESVFQIELDLVRPLVSNLASTSATSVKYQIAMLVCVIVVVVERRPAGQLETRLDPMRLLGGKPNISIVMNFGLELKESVFMSELQKNVQKES